MATSVPVARDGPKTESGLQDGSSPLALPTFMRFERCGNRYPHPCPPFDRLEQSPSTREGAVGFFDMTCLGCDHVIGENEPYWIEYPRDTYCRECAKSRPDYGR